MGLLVPAVDVGLDRVGEVGDAGVGAASDGLSGDHVEEAFDEVEPGAAGRGEVHGDAGILGQPCLHGGVLVGGVVLADHMQRHSRVCLGDLAEGGEELLVTVPGFAGVDDLAGGDLQRGEQCRGAVPLVVVGLLFGPTRAHRQHRLGTVQGLDLAFFVDADHHGTLRWIGIDANHVTDLGVQLGVGRETEPLHPMWLQTELAPQRRVRSWLMAMPRCRPNQSASRRADQCVTP